MNVYLKHILYKLPYRQSFPMGAFLEYFSPRGNLSKDSIFFRPDSSYHFPYTSLEFTDVTTPCVDFMFSDDSSIRVNIINVTSVEKTSPHTYEYIDLNEFIQRISPYQLAQIDHTGFNLPYFEGVHPDISMLREKLKHTSLYHTFPPHLEKNVNWDFILPGNIDEILHKTAIDYTSTRRPKIELVSFEKSSTPLIQFDIQIYGNYEEWSQLFPEGLAIPELKSIWIYIKNDFGIDICFVLNEVHADDWSYEFKDCRLI